MQNLFRPFKLVIGIIALLFIILDSKTAITGAREGIDLCLKTVIPALFPAMIFSETLIRNNFFSKIPLVSKIFSMCKLPNGSEKYYITGLLAGYPVGAKLIGQDYSDGVIKSDLAENALIFCSNAGPAFIFGICGAMFAEIYAPVALWLIHIVAAFLTAVFYCSGKVVKNTTDYPIRTQPSFITVVTDCVKAMGYICGWIVLFRVIISFMREWFLWMLPPEVASIFCGIIELTNGMVSLSAVDNYNVRFILCSMFLGFGGICVATQTASVTKGLSIAKYLSGKCFQTLLSFCFSLLFVILLNAGISSVHAISIVLLLAVASTIVILVTKKYVDFPKDMIYNHRKRCSGVSLCFSERK